MFIVDHFVKTEALEILDIRSGRSANHMCTKAFGNLRSKRAHATCCAMDQDADARPGVHHLAHNLQCCRARGRKRCGCGKLNQVGDCRHRRFRSNHVFRIGALGKAKDPVAHLESIDSFAPFGDFTSKILSDRERKLRGHDLFQIALPDFPINRVHTCIVNSYENLIVCDRQTRYFFKLQRVGITIFMAFIFTSIMKNCRNARFAVAGGG